MNKSEKFWDMLATDFDKQGKDEKVEQAYLKMIENTKQYLNVSDKVSELADSVANENFQIIETESLYTFGSQSNYFIVAKKI